MSGRVKIVLACPKPREPFTPYGPPIGLCYIASVLKKNGYRDVSGVDLNVNSFDEYQKLVKNADVVGIYCSTKTFLESIKMAKNAKKINPNITVVLGGPHPSLCPEEVISQESVDVCCVNEGEYAMLELVQAINNKTDFSDVKGIWFKNNGKVEFTGYREIIKNLDELPFPDRTIFDLDKYKSTAITICASRGCPFRCTNCQPALTKFTGPFRFRSVHNVIEEIKQIRSNWEVLHFVDNVLTVNRNWITTFCKELINKNLKVKWDCQSHVNTTDEELLQLMKDAGCMNVGIGIESGSQRVLDLIRKGITLQKAADVVKIAKKVNIPLHAWFMIGIPGETRGDIENTIEFAKSLDVDSIGFSIGTPWPSTGFYHDCKTNGWLLTSYWGEFNEKKYSRIKTPDFCPEDIAYYREKILSDFKKMGWIINEDDFMVYRPRSFLKRSVEILLQHAGVLDAVIKLRRKLTRKLLAST